MSEENGDERGASAPRVMTTEPAPPASRVADAPRSPTPRRRWLPLLAAGAVLLTAVFGLWYGLFRDTGPKDDPGRLQGEWAITLAGRSPDKDPNRPINVVRVDGDRWTYVSGGKETSTWRVTLNPDANPKQLDLTRLDADDRPMTFTTGPGRRVEQKQLGVYALDGDTLTLALAPEQNGRPTRLDDPDTPALTLTRVKP